MMAARSVSRGERSREAQRADDGRLVERLVGGDSSAWATLVERCGPIIYGAIGKTLRRYGRDSAEAADIEYYLCGPERDGATRAPPTGAPGPACH